MTENVLEVRNLRKYFPLPRGVLSRTVGYVKAIDGVDLTIRRGETLGVVGESGCGKTTLGWLILNLLEPTAGEVLFDGVNVARYEQKVLRRRMQVIFQDPYSSLDPRMTVEQIIAEPLVIHRIGNSQERRRRVSELLGLVGLRPEHGRLYPHEFSGGQRQRIGIARALALKPELIICDEPISALDVSIQSQILNLLADLQERLNLTYFFISHDLRVVEHVSDRMVVMYLGRVVEIATSIELNKNPYHPYSEALLSSRPVPDPTAPKRKNVMEGDVPSPINPPPGCHFSSRCPYSSEQCRREPAPSLEEISPDHWVRCWRVREIRELSPETSRPVRRATMSTSEDLPA